jgi:hypothetical protein
MHYPVEAIPPDAEFDGMAISHTCLPKGFGSANEGPNLDEQRRYQALPDDIGRTANMLSRKSKGKETSGEQRRKKLTSFFCAGRHRRRRSNDMKWFATSLFARQRENDRTESSRIRNRGFRR